MLILVGPRAGSRPDTGWAVNSRLHTRKGIGNSGGILGISMYSDMLFPAPRDAHLFEDLMHYCTMFIGFCLYIDSHIVLGAVVVLFFQATCYWYAFFRFLSYFLASS